jgi:effector-binding domain-containing protein
LTIWRRPEDGLVDYAPGLPVPDTFEPQAPIECLTLQGRAAHLSWRGPYEGLGAAWGRLFEACAAQSWSLTRLNWEIYTSPGSPDGAEPQTDLYALLA